MIEVDPSVASTYLNLANLCYIQEDYQNTIDYCIKAIELEENNLAAYLLLARGNRGQKDNINAIVNLTKAISIKDGFINNSAN